MKNSKILSLVCLSIPLLAKPSGGAVVEGRAQFSHPETNGMHIDVSDGSVIHWDDFSIGKGEWVRFVQPGYDATVLNRVVSGKLSEIHGLLEANGKIYLVNPAGIFVGKEGAVHAAGFIASTFDFTLDQEGMLFKGDSKAQVINEGRISTPGGDVLLFGYQVVNEGGGGCRLRRDGSGARDLAQTRRT